MNKLLFPILSSLLLGINIASADDQPIAPAKPVGHEVQSEKDTPKANIPELAGHPITSVVVTQCSQVVAVYVTMSDGRLIRYDHTANVPADQLVAMAYTATRSERVEISCDNIGVVGYERHDPT